MHATTHAAAARTPAPACGVDRAIATDDRTDRGFELLDRGLVRPVEAFALGGRFLLRIDIRRLADRGTHFDPQLVDLFTPIAAQFRDIRRQVDAAIN